MMREPTGNDKPSYYYLLYSGRRMVVKKAGRQNFEKQKENQANWLVRFEHYGKTICIIIYSLWIGGLLEN